MRFKRYCKALMLENNPQLIEDYKKVHAMGAAWPEITQGMKEVGILDMEIYIHGNMLFMIMETVENFNHEKAMVELAAKPRQGEWEAFVSRFQVTAKSTSADEKWQLLERIFEINQKQEYKAIDGQLKEIK